MSQTYVSVGEDGLPLSVQVRPYVRKSRRKGTPIEQKRREGMGEEEVRVVALKPNKSTLVRLGDTAVSQREIQKKKTVQSIRGKLGQSKAFPTRDAEVLRYLKEPRFVSHKIGFGVPPLKAQEAMEQGKRKILGLQYRQVHDQLESLRGRKGD